MYIHFKVLLPFFLKIQDSIPLYFQEFFHKKYLNCIHQVKHLRVWLPLQSSTPQQHLLYTILRILTLTRRGNAHVFTAEAAVLTFE